MKRLYGVTVAMITPINKQNEIDLEKTKQLVELLIKKGYIVYIAVEQMAKCTI